MKRFNPLTKVIENSGYVETKEHSVVSYRAIEENGKLEIIFEFQSNKTARTAIVYTFGQSDGVEIEFRYTGKNQVDKVGMSMELHGKDSVSWYGLGPFETMADRK